MGKITLFSADACCHSVRLKACLAEHGITDIQEINVTKHPEKRVDMMSLSNSVATPQVFFNTRFVGGVEEVVAEMGKWRKEQQELGSPYERFVHEVHSQPDPVDNRFAPPKTSLSRESSTHSSVFLDEELTLPDGEAATVVETTQLLKEILPIRDNSKGTMVYKSSFSGKQATDAFQQHWSICSKDAVKFGNLLMKQNIIQHVGGKDHTFSGKEQSFFRLYCQSNVSILNSYCAWSKKLCRDPIKLTKRLQTTIHKIEADEMNDQGKVDYVAACKHKLFPAFENAICELHAVDVSRLNNEFRIAFCLNTYNIMIKYALMKVGMAKTSSARMAFYHQVKFQVGEHVYSFHEWEHGILRGNRKAPHGLKTPFGKRDPRRQLAVTKPDGRIHFALNCGAASCPPIRFFTGDALHRELRIVTMGFCEDEANVQIKNGALYLNKIFGWYKADFEGGVSVSELPRVVEKFMHLGVNKQALTKLLEDKNGVKVNFLTYDWSVNASDIKEFLPSTLKNKCSRISLLRA